MTGPAFIGADELRARVPVAAAVEALDAAFRAVGSFEVPPRAHLAAGEGTLLVMPAVGARAAGVKVVTVHPGNAARGLPSVQGLYLLVDGDTLAPVALIDGAALTTLRTGAVSALATRHLAREDAAHLVLFGAGAQARAHLEAMAAVRPVQRVTVVSRSPGPAQELVAEARRRGLDARTGTPHAVAGADIVCTCTTSPTPVFDGERLADGVHVNAVGAYKPTMRELDDAVVRRARIVVELRATALAEAGDLVIPLRAGVVGEEAIVADLPELLAGAAVRTRPGDVTVFKSVGHALEDLAVASLAMRLG